MNAQSPDETFLTRYLLGYLAEEEQVQVEDRAFSDPAYLATLEGVEADLIDAYVRGDLRGAERLAFERRFCTSPRRLNKIEFARALMPVAAEAPALRFTASPGVAWWANLFSGRGLGPRFAAALAALTMAAGLGWLATDNAAMRSRIAAFESQGRDLQARNETAERLLSAERSRANRLASELLNQQSARPPAAPAIASLVLLPGLTRAEASRGQLVIPPSAQLARVEIQLEARDAYPQFRAELRTIDGREVLTRSNLRRRQTTAGSSVSFDVPASALAAGDYELELQGIPADRSVQELGYYYFRVLRP